MYIQSSKHHFTIWYLYISDFTQENFLCCFSQVNSMSEWRQTASTGNLSLVYQHLIWRWLVFCDVAPYSVVEVLAASITALMMKAARTSEMTINVYQTTCCNIPGDSHLLTCHYENLRSHQYLIWQQHLKSSWNPRTN